MRVVRRRPVLRSIAITVSLALVTGSFACRGSGDVGRDTTKTVQAVSLAITLADGESEKEYQLSRGADLVALLSVVDSGTALDYHHACKELAYLLVRYDDGTHDEFRLLPGHTVGRYEFRYERRSYWVDREDLFVAFDKLGVDTDLLERDRS